MTNPYNADEDYSDKVSDARKKIYELQVQTKENFDLVVKRGDNLGELERKSEELSLNAQDFKRKSSRLKVHFCLENIKVTLLIVFIIVAILLIIILSLVYRK